MRKLASLLPLSVRRNLLRFHLSRYAGADRATDRLELIETTIIEGHKLVVALERKNDALRLLVDPDTVRTPALYRYLYARLPPVIRVFARTDRSVRNASADITDGYNVPAGAFGFCADHSEAILVPDPYFFNSNGFLWAREAAKGAPTWSERNVRIVWRGTATGHGALTDEWIDSRNIRLRQRVRLCLMLRNTPDTDVGIVKVAAAASLQGAVLAKHGLIKAKVPEYSWRCCKLAIDVDGNTNSWSNFYVRLLLGCCVIKIASPAGYRQWYYDALQPWVHYVPVRADMADLLEKIDWCRSHSEECRAIAEAGQIFAMRRTMETEVAAAAARVKAANT